MIRYYTQDNLKFQVHIDYERLMNYQNSYYQKIKMYENHLSKQDSLDVTSINNTIKQFKNQIEKIDKNLKILTELSDETDKNSIDEMLKTYNDNYKEIVYQFIHYSFIEEDVLSQRTNNDFSEEEKIPIGNNDTLLISEPLDKVILPYTATEVKAIYDKEDETYQSLEDVIDKCFTRPLSDFRFQMISRYKEAIKLSVERENYSYLDGISLAFEMMKKRYLHPAIIAACRTLDELDVYLDCLDKNELDDFKIFKIQYDLYPLVLKKGIFSKFLNPWKKTENYYTDEVDIIDKK